MIQERETNGKGGEPESVTIKKPQKQGSEVEIVVAQLLGILMKQVKEQKLKKTKKSVDEEKSQQGSYKRVCPWECLGQVSSLRKPLATSTMWGQASP